MKKTKDVYACMGCKKQFEVLPQPPVCDVCGMPLNAEKVRFVYEEKNEYAITIKISDKAALDSMRKGIFWFQSPKYYQDFSENDAVGDINECAFENILDIPADKIKEYIGLKPGDLFRTNDREYHLQSILGGKLYVTSSYQNYYRLLCFYTLHLDNQKCFMKPDERMKQFGTHFFVVKNMGRLIQILGEKVEKASYDLSFLHTPIAYISDKYRGVYAPGCKFEKYRYQNEYRFILSSPEYAKLPEKEKKIITLDKVAEEEIFSEPIPIELLWEKSNFEEIAEAVNH